MNRLVRAAVAAAFAACFALPALAQSGAQRLECAKKEGEVMVYHSTQTEDLRPVFDAFT